MAQTYNLVASEVGEVEVLVAALYTVPTRPGEVLQWGSPNLEHTSGPHSPWRPQNLDFRAR